MAAIGRDDTEGVAAIGGGDDTEGVAAIESGDDTEGVEQKQEMTLRVWIRSRRRH